MPSFKTENLCLNFLIAAVVPHCVSYFATSSFFFFLNKASLFLCIYLLYIAFNTLPLCNTFTQLFFHRISNRCSVKRSPESCNFIEKKTLAQVFSFEFCEISKDTFSCRAVLVADSAVTVGHIPRELT